MGVLATAVKPERAASTDKGIIAGKLKGQMAAPTPSGSILVKVSMSRETSMFLPNSSVGMLVAIWTTCNPLVTSPMASAKVFPCSKLIIS